MENKQVWERVKTFDDAYHELGESHPYVASYIRFYDWGKGEDDTQTLAFLKLRIIITALNERWAPQFKDDENRYQPLFWFYSMKEVASLDEKVKRVRKLMYLDEYQTDHAGFAFAYSIVRGGISDLEIDALLCLKSEELSDYCGKQFINLWADLNLARKQL